MKRTLITILIFGFMATMAQAVCPPQRWADVNGWYFVPDMNYIQVYPGECIRIEQDQRFGWWPNYCDPEGLTMTIDYQLFPVSTFSDANNTFDWTPPVTGNYYLTVAVTDTPPDGADAKTTTMTYGIKVVPRNVPPVIEPEIVNKLPFGD